MFPPTADVLYVRIFTAFNRDLALWGYLDDPRFKFADTVRREYRLAASKKKLEEWVAEKEAWLNEGDRILQNIEDTLHSDHYSDAYYDTREVRRSAYRLLCRTALSMQYMMATVEFTLDELSVGNIAVE